MALSDENKRRAMWGYAGVITPRVPDDLTLDAADRLQILGLYTASVGAPVVVVARTGYPAWQAAVTIAAM